MLKTKILTGFLALSLPIALMACDSNDDDDVAGIPAPGDETGTPSDSRDGSPTPFASPTGGDAGEDTVTIDLEEQNGSGVSGTVRLEADGDQTRVTIEADDMGGDATTPRPAHIHAGTCDDLDAVPEYPLEDIVDGKSETLVDVQLSELLDGEYAVNVHRSSDAIDEYIACGEIKE